MGERRTKVSDGWVSGMGEFEEQSSWGFETRAVHTGQEPDPVTGAVVTPISLSTTFAQDGVGGHKGFEYSRSGNPTRAALEACVASLEGGRHGLAFASGLAAEDNVLRLLQPGDRVLLGNDAYGGTFRLISKVHTGLAWTAVDLIDTDRLAAEWPSDTKLVWLETPTNPLLRCFDIEAICDIAHANGRVGLRRQHLRHTLPAATAVAGGRRGRALGHEVPRRAQ